MVTHLMEVLNNGDLMENEGAEAAAATTKSNVVKNPSSPSKSGGEMQSTGPKKVVELTHLLAKSSSALH